jgi:hypothetical protein
VAFDACTPRWDGRRLLRFLTALALLVLAFGAQTAAAGLPAAGVSLGTAAVAPVTAPVAAPGAAAPDGAIADERAAEPAGDHGVGTAPGTAPGAAPLTAPEAVQAHPAAVDAVLPVGPGQRPAAGRAPPLA